MVIVLWRTGREGTQPFQSYVVIEKEEKKKKEALEFRNLKK
jgi:hypothetical protein